MFYGFSRRVSRSRARLRKLLLGSVGFALESGACKSGSGEKVEKEEKALRAPTDLVVPTEPTNLVSIEAKMETAAGPRMTGRSWVRKEKANKDGSEGDRQ